MSRLTTSLKTWSASPGFCHCVNRADDMSFLLHRTSAPIGKLKTGAGAEVDADASADDDAAYYADGVALNVGADCDDDAAIPDADTYVYDGVDIPFALGWQQ